MGGFLDPPPPPPLPTNLERAVVHSASLVMCVWSVCVLCRSQSLCHQIVMLVFFFFLRGGVGLSVVALAHHFCRRPLSTHTVHTQTRARSSREYPAALCPSRLTDCISGSVQSARSAPRQRPSHFLTPLFYQIIE